MKAFAIASRDTQPTVQDLPNPQPAPGEVLVQVEAASVNGFDLSVAAGYVWDMIPHEFPVVLGRDLVGLVTAVGDGVEDFAVGDRVAGVIPGMALGPRTGALAESVAVPASALTGVPTGVDAQQAAVVGLAGIAAYDALAALNIRPGETVLVSGATGGVGSIAVQLARQAGATVIGTARPGEEEQPATLARGVACGVALRNYSQAAMRAMVRAAGMRLLIGVHMGRSPVGKGSVKAQARVFQHRRGRLWLAAPDVTADFRAATASLARQPLPSGAIDSTR